MNSLNRKHFPSLTVTAAAIIKIILNNNKIIVTIIVKFKCSSIKSSEVDNYMLNENFNKVNTTQ